MHWACRAGSVACAEALLLDHWAEVEPEQGAPNAMQLAAEKGRLNP